MLPQKPATETKTIAEVRGELDEVVGRVRREEIRVILEADGAPAAAIVSTEDLRRLRRFDEDMDERRRVVEAMREPFRDVPPEEIERETARIMAEIREENRRARQKAANNR